MLPGRNGLAYFCLADGDEERDFVRLTPDGALFVELFDLLVNQLVRILSLVLGPTSLNNKKSR